MYFARMMGAKLRMIFCPWKYLAPLHQFPVFARMFLHINKLFSMEFVNAVELSYWNNNNYYCNIAICMPTHNFSHHGLEWPFYLVYYSLRCCQSYHPLRSEKQMPISNKDFPSAKKKIIYTCWLYGRFYFNSNTTVTECKVWQILQKW